MHENLTLAGIERLVRTGPPVRHLESKLLALRTTIPGPGKAFTCPKTDPGRDRTDSSAGFFPVLRRFFSSVRRGKRLTLIRLIGFMQI